MLFMVIETFRDQDAKSVYRRLRDRGRLMPDGDVVDFEIVPVLPGKETAAALADRL
jgi:hypothetical protein